MLDHFLPCDGICGECCGECETSGCSGLACSYIIVGCAFVLVFCFAEAYLHLCI